MYVWARKNDHWQPHPRDERKLFQRLMADSLREEHRVDAKGRRHRSKLPVITYSGGVQQTFWGDIDHMPRPLVQKNVTQRRNQIVADCVQLRVDVDHFNDEHPDEESIQLELDFNYDVEEKLLEMSASSTLN